MRKFFFFVILVIGAGIGLSVAVASKAGWGVGVVMMGVGLIIAAPIAGALTGIGQGSGSSMHRWSEGGEGTFGSLFKGDSPLRRWDR